MSRSQCPRVAQNIECPECGYPYSEAAYGLERNNGVNAPDWLGPARTFAYDPVSKRYIPDPGHSS